MSWVRLTDTFPEDPKIDGLSDRAFRLFVTGLCYSARNLTDGYLTEKTLDVVAASAGVPRRSLKLALNELEVCRLWHRYGSGYWIEKYLEYNPSAAQVRTDRAKAKSRMRRIRSGEQTAERSDEQEANVRAKFGDPDPSRPVTPSGSSSVSTPSFPPVVPESEEGFQHEEEDPWHAPDLLKEMPR
jgi:hypothetical protein